MMPISRILFLLFAFSNISLHAWEIGLDVGSVKNRYFVPNSADLLVSGQPFQQCERLEVYLRARSINSAYFVGRSYDFSAYGIWEVREAGWRCGFLKFGTGAGLNVRARFVKDVRSEARSSAEPLMVFSFSTTLGNRMSLSMPLWFSFYLDGLSVTPMPEYGITWKKMDIFVRFEFPQYLRYSPWQHESVWDAFLGVKWRIGSE